MPLNEKMRSAIQAALDCHSICVETVVYCLGMGGDHAAPSHIKLLLDCADICQTSAGFMARDSAHHAMICEACAEICDRCADSCEQLGDGGEMRRCAEACRRCAAECREMIEAA